MRKSMIAKGKWKHSVPRQEEGEPEPKHPRWYEKTLAGLDLGAPLAKTPTSAPAAAAAGGPDTPDSLPALEDSPSAEGESHVL